MQITEKVLQKILVDPRIISQQDFSLAKKIAQEKKENLLEIIVEQRFITDEELGRLISDYIGFPFVNLRKTKIKRDVLYIIPEIVSRKHKAIVFERTKEGIKIALINPEDLEIREFIERKTGEKVIPYYATEQDIRESFKYYKRDIKEEFKEIIQKSLQELEKSKEKSTKEPLPIIKAVDVILQYGYDNRASDIHIEPYEKKTLVRYRIDGILHDVLEPPKIIHDFLISRVKILSELRTDVHDAAQDGHFSFETQAEKVDVRVSIVPVEKGEKVVLRLLSERARRFALEDLGLESQELEVIHRNIKKPFGMILVSGPTGCGKTTTLYAILKILNVREVNICTIEDPIEYDIEGINQIQVNPKTGLTFTKGLRAIIRQDPNIIMIGEIRDEETASLAVNSAMTGHLVLSTFHATDAATALTRFLDMKIEPFLLSTCLSLVVSQRLVRKICLKCIESYEIPFSQALKFLGEEFASKFPKTKENKVRLFRGKGCDLCQHTGYLGRIGIFEVLEIKESIKNLIMKKANAFGILAEARKFGMRTMGEDGVLKIGKGITSLEEVLRAIRE